MRPERLGEDVRRELDRFGSAGAIADVVSVWPQSVGPQISENAWPARIARDGVLHVATSSSAWAFELGLLESTLAARLAETLGPSAPKRLRFAPGPLPERGLDEPQGHPETAPSVTEQHRFAGEQLAAGIENEDLRELVARAAAASLARPPDDRSVW